MAKKVEKYQYEVRVSKVRKGKKRGLFSVKKTRRTPKDPDIAIETRDYRRAVKMAKELNKDPDLKAKVGKKMSDEHTISLEQRFNTIEEGADPGEDTPATRRNLRNTIGSSEVLNPDIPYEHITAEEIYSGEALEDLEGIDLKERKKEREDRRIRQEIYDMRSRLMDEREQHEEEKKEGRKSPLEP